MKNNAKRIFSGLLAAMLIVVVSLSGCGQAQKPLSAAELLSLGEKYLLEMNYEQALVYFEKLIEIEPKNPRGYIGAAEAYVAIGEPEKAIAILTQGLTALPDDSRLDDKRTEIEAAMKPEITSSPTPEPTSEPTATPTPEPTATPEPTPTPEPEPIAFNEETFDYIGKSVGEITGALGTYTEINNNGTEEFYKFGDFWIAFVGDMNNDAFAYAVQCGIAAFFKALSGDVSIDALNVTFGAESATNVGNGRSYQHNGVPIAFLGLVDGKLSSTSTVRIGSETKPEPTATATPTQAPTQAPTQTQAPSQTQAPTPAPTQEPTPQPIVETPVPEPEPTLTPQADDLLPIPALPEEEDVEIDIPVYHGD